jgi:hypothetical protein
MAAERQSPTDIGFMTQQVMHFIQESMRLYSYRLKGKHYDIIKTQYRASIQAILVCLMTFERTALLSIPLEWLEVASHLTISLHLSFCSFFWVASTHHCFTRPHRLAP